MGHIHWPVTARMRKLMVKQFDRGSASHVWVVFDQHVDSQAGEGATGEVVKTRKGDVVVDADTLGELLPKSFAFD